MSEKSLSEIKSLVRGRSLVEAYELGRESLRASLAEAEAHIAELREVVKSLEWAASVWEDTCDDCPEEENEEMCMECFAHHHAGHEKDCKLNKALSRPRSEALKDLERRVNKPWLDAFKAILDVDGGVFSTDSEAPGALDKAYFAWTAMRKLYRSRLGESAKSGAEAARKGKEEKG